MKATYLYKDGTIRFRQTFHTSSKGLFGNLHLFIQSRTYAWRKAFALVQRVDGHGVR